MLNKDKNTDEIKNEKNPHIPRTIVKRMKMDHLSVTDLNDAANILHFLKYNFE